MFNYEIDLDDNKNIEIDDCKQLMLKIISQAIRDFADLEHHLVSSKQVDYEYAVDFLFDPNYLIQWGNIEIGLEHMAELLEIEVDWIRRKALMAKDLRNEKRKARGQQE